MSEGVGFKQVGNKKQVMPPGYVMAYTGSHFLYIRESDEVESAICWDKWTIYRWAWEDYHNWIEKEEKNGKHN